MYQIRIPLSITFWLIFETISSKKKEEAIPLPNIGADLTEGQNTERCSRENLLKG
jgi:hypothetical protein